MNGKSPFPKYRYPEPVKITNRQWPDRIITKPPVWASVDLRDGNQALPAPMSPSQKLEYFKMLVKLGFKEIEVSFPAASQDDFDFVRMLIESRIIPEDVRISVLTQAREELIVRTLEALKGVPSAILHIYLASSDLHRKFVFGMSREEAISRSVQATAWGKREIERQGLSGRIGYEFSPEEFTDTDLGFALELSHAVKEEWGKCAKSDFILNLPATVERRPPNQYADMIESFCSSYRYGSETTISLHAHNDQGCAVAASELALLAGAERVEGTIFGHGERTGNLDISVLALNLYTRGIDPGLDFSDMNEVIRVVENASGIEVHPRHPYAGELVFTAFSGSHQDAIRKGLDKSGEISDFYRQGWKIPYLHIDPADVGREYSKLIRINSQSGKGGVVYVLEKEFDICPPKAMHPDIGREVQKFVDKTGGEIDAGQLLDIFRESFVNVVGPYSMSDFTREILSHENGDRIAVGFKWYSGDKCYELKGEGNGPLSAFKHALDLCPDMIDFELADFSEKTMGKDADAHALAFVGIRIGNDTKLIYGAGEHTNIDRAAIAALITALNRASREK